MRDDDRRQRPRRLQPDALLLRVRRLTWNVSRYRTLGLRHAAEVLLDELLRLSRLEIADQHQRRIRRDVVRGVEVAHIVNRGGFEVLHAADGGMLVWMCRERLVVDDLVEPSIRLVVHAHPPLFLHHFTFVDERVAVDAERRHPVGLEPQRQRQIVRRHGLPEHRFIVGGIRVRLPPDPRDERCMRFGLYVFRSLEHHVLEEVRSRCAPSSRSGDVNAKLQVDDRRG
jgi:hypothetical protein